MVYILDFIDFTLCVNVFILTPGGQANGLTNLDNWVTMYVVVFKLYYTILFPYSRFDEGVKKTT